jgi:hypothetical protein
MYDTRPRHTIFAHPTYALHFAPENSANVFLKLWRRLPSDTSPEVPEFRILALTTITLRFFLVLLNPSSRMPRHHTLDHNRVTAMLNKLETIKQINS